jgi:hypothetical protein
MSADVDGRGNHLGAIHAPSIARVGVVARITGKHAQVHDGPGELVDEIDHLGDRRSGGGADGDKRARSDDRAVTGFVKESPDEKVSSSSFRSAVMSTVVIPCFSIRRRLTPDCTAVPVYASAAPKISLPKVFAASVCMPGSTCW